MVRDALGSSRDGCAAPVNHDRHVPTTLESTMNENLRLTLGNAAREARRALGLTQEKVAERLGVSVEFYGRVERGVAWPSIEVFARMVSVLGVSADVLLDIDTGAAPEPTPLTWQDDSPEIRELMALVCRASPAVVRLISTMVRELERVQAARMSPRVVDPDIDNRRS
jgi:transcriptional regulator with XRE-family HTH domain